MLHDLRAVLEAEEQGFLIHHFDYADELPGSDVIVFCDGAAVMVDSPADLRDAPVKGSIGLP